MGKLENLIFGDYSKRQIKKIKPTADLVDSLADKYSKMTDEELGSMTEVLRGRLAEGETLDALLPDAYAAVREAADRVLGKRPFYVQILGGILLHQGRITEMRTGEGKTLVATMPAYLNALTGNGVHIVTVNEYLAKRDAAEMGRVYEALGMTTGVVLNDMSHRDKQAQYRADITYATNSAFGFDYLRDNLQTNKDALFQRGHNFCIVDEIDSILIDEARTPLIISGMSGESTDEYVKCNSLVRGFSKKVVKEYNTKENIYQKLGTEAGTSIDDEQYDYIVDEKHSNAFLTPRGAKKVEQYFNIENLNDPENSSISHSVNQAIHAYGVKKRDIDYTIQNGEIIIIDKYTGRLMPGRRYQDGLHQAIEAKEGVDVRGEMRVSATVTIQNYFRMYKKLSGMTGTAKTEEDEFREIYGLDVVEVPTNKPMIRVDHPDRVFTDEDAKFAAIVKQIVACHEKGQPVLIGTASVEKSEKLSKLLTRAKLPHNVLNAKNHEKEAYIIAEAGRFGAITIATNMAGRGTDIMLGGNYEHLAKKAAEPLLEQIASLERSIKLLSQAGQNTRNTRREITDKKKQYNGAYKQYLKEFRERAVPEKQKVIEAGGLYIIGSERHDSRRIDNQLRGRAGRQGDPGESTFFISLNDSIMRLFGDERVVNRFAAMSQNMLKGSDGDISQNTSILSGVMEKAQKRVEGAHFKSRKNVLQYDDVMNEQRKEIYSQRQDIMFGRDLSNSISSMVSLGIEESVSEAFALDDISAGVDQLYREYGGWGLLPEERESLLDMKESKVAELITENVFKTYDERREKYGEEIFSQFERIVLMTCIDHCWIDHIDAMEDLKDYITLQSYAQRDPLVEYQIQGSAMFSEMLESIRQSATREIMTARIEVEELKDAPTVQNVVAGKPTQRKKPSGARQPERRDKIDRNALCPCGSGKKYKRCCGARSGSGDNS